MAQKRKTFSRRADIPPDLLGRLNRGEENPLTLAEWLAVDPTKIAVACLPEIGLADAVAAVVHACDPSQNQGTMKRLRAIGSTLCEVLLTRADGDAIYESLATHRASLVREWGAMTLPANPRLSIEERLERAKRFARDESMGVPEIAWTTYRPFVAPHLARVVELLEP